MMKDKIIPFPTFTSLTSSQPKTQQPIISTFNSFDLEYISNTEKKQKFNKNQNRQKIIPLKRKRRITTENLKNDIQSKTLTKRNSWNLMRNLVRGVSFIQRPQISFIKNQVITIFLFFNISFSVIIK